MDENAALAAARVLCIEFEGFYAWPYDDLHPRAGRVTRANQGRVEGTVTIGHGETNPETLAPYLDDPSLEMSEDEAGALLTRRLVEHWEPSRRHLTTELNPNQLGAWISVAYNAGPAGLAKKAPETLRAINERRFDDVAHPDASKKYGWGGLLASAITRDQSGRVSDGLVRRRASECALFATPYTGQEKGPPLMFICGYDGEAWLCSPTGRLRIIDIKLSAALEKAGVPNLGIESDNIGAIPPINEGVPVKVLGG